MIFDTWKVLLGTFWHPGAPFGWRGEPRGLHGRHLGVQISIFDAFGSILAISWHFFFRHVGIFSWFWWLNLRPEAAGCFLSDLGWIYCRNMRVRCKENLINTDVFRSYSFSLILLSFVPSAAAVWHCNRVRIEGQSKSVRHTFVFKHWAWPFLVIPGK